MSVNIALLGEVTAHVGRRPVDLGPPRQRCVLAALTTDAGRLVPADRLMGRVWGADTPRRRRAALQTHISRLRGAFAGALAIVHRSDGYTLEVAHPDQAVDLLRFRGLCDQARGGSGDARKAELLTEALALWRGLPLCGLSGVWVEGERDRWLQERGAAEHDLVDAQLSLGLGEELVASLSARAARHPLNERLAGQYMLALHRAGRPADALNHYRQLRGRLTEELGTDPGTALQDLHQQILAGATRLDPAPPNVVARPVVVPRQLPASPTAFVGRREELDQLGATRPVVLITAIGGAGGIGKTWLALAWAHRHLDRFPDGQLFVDLHGFSPAGPPLAPDAALFGFLTALGVAPDRIPADLAAKAALYRSLVAGRRLLVVLDNAATSDQVRPLLPGGPAGTVLVTGRTRLASLIDRHGARHLQLDVLNRAEARTLLIARLGIDRAGTEPRAVDELIELCGGYPLALSITARNAACRPAVPLAEIAAELRELGLEMLDHDNDPTASLPAVLSWSLRSLSGEQRTVFSLLGIVPGPDTTLPAVTALTGLSPGPARKALTALEDASLIERRPHGRYATHDLIRSYAAATAHDLAEPVRESALRRVVDFYLHTAFAADRLLNPYRPPIRLGEPVAGVHPHPLPDGSIALEWLDKHHPHLLAAQAAVAARRHHQTVWHLAWTLTIFHQRRGRLDDDLAVWQAALGASDHLPDPISRIHAHRFLGSAHAELDHHEQAIGHLRQALALAEERNDPVQQAHTHLTLATAWQRQGHARSALEHARRALDFFRTLDQPVWEAEALNLMGWHAAHLGEHNAAREHCRTALVLLRRHHDPHGEAAILDTLGYVDHCSGQQHEAIRHYRQALTLYRGLGHSYQVANTLANLGHPHAALGQHEEANEVWREAVELYREQGRDEHALRLQRQLDG